MSSDYHKHFSAETIQLYVILTSTLRVRFFLHYIALHCITLHHIPSVQNSERELIQGGPGSVRFSKRFGDGTVQAVPVFGSGGSSAKRVFLCFSGV